MTRLRVLDLGSGPFPYPAQENDDVVTVDIRPEAGPTVVHDLTVFPYPFDDNSFDVVYASHVLEHLPDNIRVMEEIYRVAKPAAKVVIRVPHYTGRSAWGDPTHIRAYSAHQFHYYSRQRRDRYGDCDFQLVREELRHTRMWRGYFVSKVLSPTINFFANLNIRFCEKVWCYWVGGFSELYVELRPIKEA